MKILHITLGNPKTHQGGLCRYCVELAEEQKKRGDEVDVLYPGTFFSSQKPKIKKSSKGFYKIMDALPVPITYGIDEPKRYMVCARKNNFLIWLNAKKYNIVHVHSIQGIHIEFFEAVKTLNIPMVFTTHDYYPICFRSVLVDSYNNLCENWSFEKCAICNCNTGLPQNKQQILQSDMYQRIKNSQIMNLLKQRFGNLKKDNICKKENIDTLSMDMGKSKKENYKKLKKYYQRIFQMFSLVHCNSEVAKKQYEKVFPKQKYVMLSITHDKLNRCEHFRENTGLLHISYMGGMSLHKGYKVVMDAFNELEQKEFSGNWILSLYGGQFSERKEDDRYHYGGFFDEKDADDVWKSTDLLIVASQWFETFGFVVLEALCRGIPVLCSDFVGSIDLVKWIDEELIFVHNDSNELAKKIGRFLDEEYYVNIQKKINASAMDIEMDKHTEKISQMYLEIDNQRTGI